MEIFISQHAWSHLLDMRHSAISKWCSGVAVNSMDSRQTQICLWLRKISLMVYGAMHQPDGKFEYVVHHIPPINIVIVIQLGQFDDDMSPEDEIGDWQHRPFTEEIDAILSPHLATLLRMSRLQEDDKKYLDQHIAHLPAYHYSKGVKTAAQKMSYACRGDLSVADCAHIMNWLHCNIIVTGKSMPWYDAPQSHAVTLVAAHRHKLSIAKAWDYIQNSPSLLAKHEMEREWHDPDLDAYNFLKYELLYQNRNKAGTNRASNCQWGLDVGPHANGWDPYILAAADWQNDPWSDTEEVLCKTSCITSLIKCAGWAKLQEC